LFFFFSTYEKKILVLEVLRIRCRTVNFVVLDETYLIRIFRLNLEIFEEKKSCFFMPNLLFDVQMLV